MGPSGVQSPRGRGSEGAWTRGKRRRVNEGVLCASFIGPMSNEIAAQASSGLLPNLMNRTMMADPDDAPVAGDTRIHLGALMTGEQPDIAPRDGHVCPGQGGMSVFLGHADQVRPMMSKARWPAELGGLGEHPLFQMPSEAVPAALSVVPDPPERSRKKPRTHATVQPALRCPAQDYQRAIHSTRPDWKRYKGT